MPPVPADLDLTDRARRDRRRLGWLLILTAVVVGAGIGLRDAWTPDEPRFALIARDMVDQGGWLFPRRNGELYAQKPPLFLWAVAAAYAATGWLRLAILLPSLIAAVGCVWLVADLAGRLWNRRTGIAAGLALLVCAQFAIQAKAAQIDAFLCLWTTLALYGLLRHLLLGPAWTWWALAWIAMGLGVISKGVGFLPVLALAPWLALRVWAWRDPAIAPTLPRLRLDWRWLIGPPLLLLVIAAWVVPMVLAVAASDDPALIAYRDNILVRQTRDRYVASWHHHHAWWYYLVQAAVLWLPLTPLAPWVVPAWWRRVRRCDPRIIIPLAWSLLVVLFFSLSPGKRGVYLLPAVPGVVLALAPLLPGLIRRRDVRLSAFALTATLAAALVVAGLVAVTGLTPEKILMKISRYGFPVPALGAMALAAGLAFAAIAAVARVRHGVTALIATLCLGWTLYGLVGYPLLNAGKHPTAVMAQVWDRVGDGELGIVRFREQFVLASPKVVTTFGYERPFAEESREAATWLRASPVRRLLIPLSGAYRGFTNGGGARIDIGRGDPWALIDRTALADVDQPEVAPVDGQRGQLPGQPDGISAAGEVDPE